MQANFLIENNVFKDYAVLYDKSVGNNSHTGSLSLVRKFSYVVVLSNISAYVFPELKFYEDKCRL